MITLWRPGDTFLLNARPENKWDCEDEILRVDTLASRGYAYSIWEGSARAEPLLMIMGCNKLWEGTAQVWALPSYEARGHAKYLVDMANVLLERVGEMLGIHRYHTLIHPHLYENIKWIKLLGFKAESVLHAAGPKKENIIMYAKTYLEGYHEQTKQSRARLAGYVGELFEMEYGHVFTPSSRRELCSGKYGQSWIEEGLRAVE